MSPKGGWTTECSCMTATLSMDAWQRFPPSTVSVWRHRPCSEGCMPPLSINPMSTPTAHHHAVNTGVKLWYVENRQGTSCSHHDPHQRCNSTLELSLHPIWKWLFDQTCVDVVYSSGVRQDSTFTTLQRSVSPTFCLCLSTARYQYNVSGRHVLVLHASLF